MRWKKMIATVLAGAMLLAGASCKKATVNTSPEFNFETDAHPWLADSVVAAIAESETGFYYFSDHTYSILTYLDKETMQSIPLCNKPNCVAHDDPRSATSEEEANCNAFFHAEKNRIFYYQGNLYYVTLETIPSEDVFRHSFYLVQLSLDGTERKAVWEIDPGVPVGFASLWDFILHRGKFYFTVNNVLYSYDLDNEKVAEIRKFETLPTLYAMGDHLFVRSKGNWIDEGDFRYTISTGEWKKYPEDHVTLFPYPDGMYFFCADAAAERNWGVDIGRDGTTATIISYKKELTIGAISRQYLCAKDINRFRRVETGEFLSSAEYVEIFEDCRENSVDVDKVVEMLSDETWEIYDRETMEILGSVAVIPKDYFLWFSEDRLYCFVGFDTEAESAGDASRTIYYADLADLGSDAFAWKVVEPSR